MPSIWLILSTLVHRFQVWTCATILAPFLRSLMKSSTACNGPNRGAFQLLLVEPSTACNGPNKGAFRLSYVWSRLRRDHKWYLLNGLEIPHFISMAYYINFEAVALRPWRSDWAENWHITSGWYPTALVQWSIRYSKVYFFQPTVMNTVLIFQRRTM